MVLVLENRCTRYFSCFGGFVHYTDCYRCRFQAAGPVGAIEGATAWGLEGTLPFQKSTSRSTHGCHRKPRSSRLSGLDSQDLNAYHNLDAEVELPILSEQVALEIDREILGDLVNGARRNLLLVAFPGCS